MLALCTWGRLMRMGSGIGFSLPGSVRWEEMSHGGQEEGNGGVKGQKALIRWDQQSEQILSHTAEAD